MSSTLPLPFMSSSGSLIAREIAAVDWASTSLGPMAGWPTALRSLLATMQACPTPMFLAWGPDLLSFYNETYRPILGYRADSAMGKPFQELWSSIWDDISPLVDGALSGESLRVTDMQLDLSRGGEPEESYWSFTYSPAYDDDGRIAGMLCVTGETTDRVIAERRRRESDERLQLALSAGNGVGIWDWDVRNDCVRSDARFATLYGVDPARAEAGAPVAEFFQGIAAEDLPRVQREIDAAIRDGTTFHSEYRIVRPDGSVRWVAAQGTCIRDEAGTCVHFPGVSFDITERVLAEQQIRESEARERQNASELERRVAERTAELMKAEEALRQAHKMEAVGQLTGGLAHDFNNLLAGISGALELMNMRVAQGRIQDIDRYMVAAQGATKRAAALTHRLLAFSRRQTLAPVPININSLVSGMSELIQRTVGPSIAVETVGASGLWTALVDPSQLENALLNLCINARDAMPDGGKITIETANRWLDRSAARLHDVPDGQYLSLCVTDNGTGMPAEVIEKAFDPFFTTKPLGQGTGLGLSMIYGFAQQSGGQVRIYSEPGLGTTVCIYLPRHYAEAAEEDAVPIAPPEKQSGSGETVLVVDDEPTVRLLILEVLEELGYTALEAHDSVSGLRILQAEGRIDLLITDVGLPGGMNGRQMADAGRQHRPGLKVLFITGYAENAVLNHGHLGPGMAVLTKPFAMETLASRIGEALGQA